MSERPVYATSGLSHAYNGRTVVNLDTLTVMPGEILALVGPSGAGKSTLLRLLAFLERPTTGRIVFQGRTAVDGWPDLAARRDLTMVFQRPKLLQRSVFENVAYGLKLRGEKRRDAAIAAVLARLGLAELAGAQARTLSGGEMQRVALARALVLRPRVLLLDEPTANLDPYNIRLIEEMVLHANAALGMTVVVVTHNIFQARRLAQRVGLMLAGRMVEVAATEAFFNAPARPETAAFVRGDMVY